MIGPFYLVHETARQRACEAVRAADQGMVVVIRKPNRSLDQNAALHRALGCVASQYEWHGKKLDIDIWKRLCTAAWLREIGESPEMIPAIDGKGFDVIFERTSTMTVSQMSSLIEWVHSFGAQNGVRFD